ncbi:CRISPR type III-associated RAMP domain-containing protein [Candidatus Magnetomoraceae bacterium gMMP-15]
MPQSETFWNPYRLIPIKENIKRKKPLTDEKFQGESGIISCSLKNLTPLFVGINRHNKEQFLKRIEKHVIPGSSIKGMLRSLSEIVGGGCFVVTDPKSKCDKAYAACNNSNYLCIACRMFGMMERGKGAKVHKGNISVGDALLREEKPNTKLFEVLLSSCGTRHEPFYRSPHTGKLDGKSRKLYFHQPKRKDSVPNIPPQLQRRTQNIRALLPGYHFDFEIQFSNLTKEELELLIYTLILEEYVEVTIGEENLRLQGPLRHKIGYAKPLGLGSCHITINKLSYLEPASARFTSLQNLKNKVYEGNELKTHLDALIQNIVKDKTDTMQQFRKMMVWDENDPRKFQYPNYNWFRNPENSQKTLKII